MNKNKLIKVKNELESLIFWLRNIKIAKNENDEMEIKKSDETINFIFNQLDELKVTLRTQNDIIREAQKESCNIDITDIIKNLTIYFKDKDNTIVKGADLLHLY